MLRRAVLITSGLMLVFIPFMGCLEEPIRSPISSRPEVNIDYADGFVRVCVKSQENRRYTQITLNVDNVTVQTEQDVCWSTYVSNKTDLKLSIIVTDGETIYLGDYEIHVVDETRIMVNDVEHDLLYQEMLEAV